MKNIYGMSHEEIIDLTDSQIENLILRQCMEEGVQIVPNPVEPEPLEPLPYVMYYKIDFERVAFLTPESMQAVVKAITAHAKDIRECQYNTHLSYDEYTLHPLERDIVVENKKGFSLTHIEERKIELEKYRQEKNIWLADKKQFDKNEELKSKISDGIRRKYYDAQHLQREIDRYRDIWDNYMKLAENNFETAQKFFQKAFPELSDEIKPYLPPFQDMPAKQKEVAQ